MKPHEMTPDQLHCFEAIKLVYPTRVMGVIHPHGPGIAVNVPDGMATYDTDTMTRLVLIAHRFHVRFSVLQSSPGRLRLVAHRRRPPEPGDTMSRRHPGLDFLRKAALVLDPSATKEEPCTS